MSTPEESLNQARYLVSQLDFPGAQQVLRGFLAQSPQDPSFASEESAGAAVLYAGVLLHLSDPHNARTWATYAHSVMRRLYGERDSRTLHTLGVLAVTEHRAGALDQSTRHYQQLITALSAAEGPDGDRALAARADAAIVEHARGLCDNARNAMGQVISAHQARYGPTHPLGIRMLVRLAAMWRDCRNPEQAHLILAQARAQASGLPPEDETHQVLSAAARAMADSSHHCGVATISPGTQAGVFPVLLVPDPQDFIAPPRPGMATRIEDEWPEDEILDPPMARPAPTYMPPPAAAPPPPVMVMTRPIAVPPPVIRVKKPPKPKRRKPWLAPTVIGLVALVAGGLVTAAILTSGQANPPQSLPSGTALASASAVPLPEPSGPVSNLRLQDNGDKLLITWIYPANAKGPIVISAAKAGEPMRALQSLPAGTESMILPGLDPAGNYCVTVTVAYQSDHLVMSPAVCTDRKR